MKYIRILYYLLYPYLLLLLQYPLHAAHNNMQQTYDLHSYLFVYSTVYLVIGMSLFFLYHCYQQINITNRCCIEVFNFIILAIYFMNFIGGIQILPVFSNLLVTSYAQGMTMIYIGFILCDFITIAFSKFHPVKWYHHFPYSDSFSGYGFLALFFHIIATKNVLHFLFPFFPI